MGPVRCRTGNGRCFSCLLIDDPRPRGNLCNCRQPRHYQGWLTAVKIIVTIMTCHEFDHSYRHGQHRQHRYHHPHHHRHRHHHHRLQPDLTRMESAAVRPRHWLLSGRTRYRALNSLQKTGKPRAKDPKMKPHDSHCASVCVCALGRSIWNVSNNSTPKSIPKTAPQTRQVSTDHSGEATQVAEQTNMKPLQFNRIPGGLQLKGLRASGLMVLTAVYLSYHWH